MREKTTNHMYSSFAISKDDRISMISSIMRIMDNGDVEVVLNSFAYYRLIVTPNNDGIVRTFTLRVAVNLC